jgi:hypothetical protein
MKLDSARNSPPNGVDPRAAARAADRSDTTRRPTASGATAAASRGASVAASSCAAAGSAGTNHAVEPPNRLPASRRAVASDTNAFGAAPCVFQ